MYGKVKKLIETCRIETYRNIYRNVHKRMEAYRDVLKRRESYLLWNDFEYEGEQRLLSNSVKYMNVHFSFWMR